MNQRTEVRTFFQRTDEEGAEKLKNLIQSSKENR